MLYIAGAQNDSLAAGNLLTVTIPAYSAADTQVNWTGLTANGTSGAVTTTLLTLTFDQEPTGLAATDITVTNATRGALTGVNATTFTLAISNITVADDANVTVAIANPSGYEISPASRNVAVNVAAATPPTTPQATPPAISDGQSEMTLTAGYAATYTAAFTITGDPTPTVTIDNTHGGYISWNNAEHRLDIAAGLSEGVYAVVITAANGELPNAAHTFTLTINAPATVTHPPATATTTDSDDWRTSAQAPRITQQPQNVTVYVDEPATLSVTASVTDGGVPAFQWYRAEGARGGSFAAFDYATDSTFYPDTSAVGVNRYRVVITNTNNAARIDGNRTARTTSRIVTVTVNEPAVEALPTDEPPAPEPEPVSEPTPLPLLRFDVGSYSFVRDGMTFTSDAAPFIDPAYDRLMVPLRIVAEALGARVEWVDATGSVNIFAGTAQVSLAIGEALPGSMGVPVIVNDRTFVPLRYVIEVLGAGVEWDDVNRVVYVYAM